MQQKQMHVMRAHAKWRRAILEWQLKCAENLFGKLVCVLRGCVHKALMAELRNEFISKLKGSWFAEQYFARAPIKSFRKVCIDVIYLAACFITCETMLSVNSEIINCRPSPNKTMLIWVNFLFILQFACS